MRRLAMECRTCRSNYLDRRLEMERRRLDAAIAKLARLEASAEQPADAGSRQEN